MSTLKIKKYPDKVLRTRCDNVKSIDGADKKLLSDMAESMYEVGGIGLAAPQVGINKNIVVFDTGKGLLKMFNPKILSKKGLASLEEGCLSVPESTVNVKRSEEICVSYIDENGKECKKVFNGLPARVIQHEIDHLNGKLIIDYLPWYKKLF